MKKSLKEMSIEELQSLLNNNNKNKGILSMENAIQ
jgi:hypothetical protein